MPSPKPSRPFPIARRPAGVPATSSTGKKGFAHSALPKVPRSRRANGVILFCRARKFRVASSPRPYPTPEGQTGSQPRHPRQASRCCRSAGSSAGISFRSSARMRTMRPRGLSASSPVTAYVGQAGRQNPQCTHGSSAARSRVTNRCPRAPPRGSRADRTSPAGAPPAALRLRGRPRNDRRSGEPPTARAPA